MGPTGAQTTIIPSSLLSCRGSYGPLRRDWWRNILVQLLDSVRGHLGAKNAINVENHSPEWPSWSYKSTWSIHAVKQLCPCEDGERQDDTELEQSFSLFLWPIWTMVWCHICCWQIYNWYTLCCSAAHQATVLQPASSWFSLSAPSTCGKNVVPVLTWQVKN